MKRRVLTRWVLLASIIGSCWGCRLREPDLYRPDDVTHFENLAAEDHFPDLLANPVDRYGMSHRPHSLRHGTPESYWDLELEQAIEIALRESSVLRDAGGAVLSVPDLVRSIHQPAITETDPRFGVDAALSEFDAIFSTSTFFENNDRAFNNRISGLGQNVIQQDLLVFETEIAKRAATGARFAVRQNIDYQNDNVSTIFDTPQGPKLFGSSWNVNWEAEVRQPLGRGRSVRFNRIAGPNGIPGQLNGVVIARINSDVSIADFELALRDLVSNVENAYWDLYYAYRDMEAKIEARDRALMAWRSISAKQDPYEAQAREQYYRFQEDVQNALSGRLIDGTRGNNGSRGGTFRGNVGVFVAERRLRLLMGLPINDSQLIRPARDPLLAEVLFDWDEVVAESLVRRAELRRQRLRVHRTEMELLATRNFLLPQLDLFALYRFRGFGNSLINSERKGGVLRDSVGDLVAPRSFDNAYMDLTTGDFQEWQMGLEMVFPVGLRQAHAALRNAQLKLARAQALLKEQERQVVYDVSNSLAELERAYEVLQTATNRRIAAKEQVDLLEEQRFRIGMNVDLNLILDAQRRKLDADGRYFRALVEYAMAIKNMHVEKGTLMEYNNVLLAEGQWPGSNATESDSPQDPPESLPPRSQPESVTPQLAPPQSLPPQAEPLEHPDDGPPPPVTANQFPPKVHFVPDPQPSGLTQSHDSPSPPVVGASAESRSIMTRRLPPIRSRPPR